MTVDSHINSLFGSVCYRVGCAAIDPGDRWEGFEQVRAVLLTHAHFDHIYGLNELIRFSPQAVVYTNEAGREMLLDARKNLSFYHETPYIFEFPEKIRVINDGEIVCLPDELSAKALFTPGHNPSCITWIIGDALFTGDAYIPGIKTVTNLPKGNKAQALASEQLIKKLAEGKRIFPGHKVN